MATTKYIVNNLSGQTIDGDITINGNLSVTGVTTGSLSTYKALLTQLGSQTGTTLSGFGGFNDGLIIGETYTITDYVSDDDFSNIADVTSGGGIILDFDYVWTPVVGFTGTFNGLTGTTSGLGSGASFDGYWCGTTTPVIINITIDNGGVDYVVGDTITILGTELSGSTPANDLTITVTDVNPNVTGCAFIATGEIPTNWSNGSTLVSSGNLVVTVLENNLGFDIEWVDGAGFDPGIYFGVNSTTGPLYNNFNRNTTFVLNGGNPNPYFGPNLLETFVGSISLSEKDDAIIVAVFDTVILEAVPDSLYYFPIEIQQQNTDTTPIVISGTVETSFPINYTSIDLRCNGNYIQSLYGDGTVNDMSELITYLNSLPNMSYLGTYSDAGDGFVNLEMTTNLVNQFCSSGTLTFEVFND
jgi:hypothetical protein